MEALFQPNTKVRMRLPRTYAPDVLCHIEAAIEFEGKRMIVYRYWSKARKRWIWEINEEWLIAKVNNCSDWRKFLDVAL